MTVSTCQAFGLQNACSPANDSSDIDFTGLSPDVVEAANNLRSDELRDIQWLSGLPQTGELDQGTLEGFITLLEGDCETQESEEVELSKDELYRNNPATIRAQKQLNRIYEGSMPPLEVDGIRGPGTTARIQMFQEAAGLETTGKLDAPTRDALYNKVGFVTEEVAEPVQADPRTPVTPCKVDATSKKSGLFDRFIDSIDTSEGGLLQRATNVAAGFGDGVSFNLTDLARSHWGGNESVDKDSVAYKGSHVAGAGVQAGLVGYALGGVTAALRATEATKALRIAVASGTLSLETTQIAESMQK